MNEECYSEASDACGQRLPALYQQALTVDKQKGFGPGNLPIRTRKPRILLGKVGNFESVVGIRDERFH